MNIIHNNKQFLLNFIENVIFEFKYKIDPKVISIEIFTISNFLLIS